MLPARRVLRPACCMVFVTYGDPAARLYYLDEFDWTIRVYALAKQVDGDDAVAATEPGGAKDANVRLLLKGKQHARSWVRSTRADTGV
jgi:hypothetical protein